MEAEKAAKKLADEGGQETCHLPPIPSRGGDELTATTTTMTMRRMKVMKGKDRHERQRQNWMLSKTYSIKQSYAKPS
jgi:hypothetical protein